MPKEKQKKKEGKKKVPIEHNFPGLRRTCEKKNRHVLSSESRY